MVKVLLQVRRTVTIESRMVGSLFALNPRPKLAQMDHPYIAQLDQFLRRASLAKIINKKNRNRKKLSTIISTKK